MKLIPNQVLSAIFTACLAVSSSQAQTTDTIKIQKGQKIAFLGDTITQVGWEKPGGYVRLVIDGFDFVGLKIIPAPVGNNNNTSHDMVHRVEKDVMPRKPDWMTLSCGLYDVSRGSGGVDFETYKNNITSIVNKAQAAGIKVMILTTTVFNEDDNPTNQKLDLYNEFLRELAREKNLPLADINESFLKAIKSKTPDASGNVLTTDGILLNPEGNMLMARSILEAFGVPRAQLDKWEAEWRNSSEATSIAGTLSLGTTAGISLASYNRLQQISVEQKIPFQQLCNNLYFNALRTVLKNHDKTPDLPQAQVQNELPDAFKEQVNIFTKTGK